MSADQGKLFEETKHILKSLIRIDTSPPGNETVAAEYLRSLFGEVGIDSELVGPDPQRQSIVARLKGNGNGRPLLLLSHLDVVPAIPESWTYDPFGGEEKDGYIWGRGALDMKMMTAMESVIFMDLARNGPDLKRDIIFASTAAEEEGGDIGLGWIAENRPELVEAEYALNEVGGFSMKAGRKRIYPVQVAEKGFCWIKIKFPGRPGHGSLPHSDNSLLHTANGIKTLLEKGFPVRVVEPVKKLLKAMADGEKFPRSLILGALAGGKLSSAALHAIPAGAMKDKLNALLRNTANPTMITAGTAKNVTPESSELVVDCRLLPGTTVDRFMEEIRNLLGGKLEAELIKGSNPQVVDDSSEMLAAIRKSVEKHDPAGEAVPYMITGFTDGRFLAPLGVKCIGFTPLKIDDEFPVYELIHGIDERVPLEGLEFGIATLHDLITRWCT